MGRLFDFLKRYFKGDENLIKPIHSSDRSKKMNKKNNAIYKEKTLSDSLSILKKRVRAMGAVIPPLIKSYMSISPSLKYYGISDNPSFGEVEELAITIHIPDIYENKKERHIKSFSK